LGGPIKTLVFGAGKKPGSWRAIFVLTRPSVCILVLSKNFAVMDMDIRDTEFIENSEEIPDDECP